MDILAADIHKKVFISFVNKCYMFRSCWLSRALKYVALKRNKVHLKYINKTHFNIYIYMHFILGSKVMYLTLR